MDLQRTIALNKWWQEMFDKKHPKEALRRKRRDKIADKVAAGVLRMAPSSHGIGSRRRTSKPSASY